MGLIKAAKEAIGSTLGDEWKEAIRCDDMGNDVLMMRKTTPNGVISNGSTIIVAPGQCAIIYDNGRVIDATAEDGMFTFDTSTTPSFFAGQFKESFKEMWQRFTYNGETSKQQAVFFFNLKEIMDNKFGTAAPVPFQDWSHPIPNRMTGSVSPLSVKIRCYGTYTFKMSNPAIFMQELAGTADIYYKSSVVEQMRSEVLASFQNVLNELGNSEHKVPVLEMPSQTDEMQTMLEERVYDEPIRRRGLRLISFSVESVTLDDESEQKINDYELSSNSYMQQGKMTNAYANAVENAASNSSGVASGFMGIGMVNMATGGMMGGMATSPWQNQNEQGNSINYDPYASSNQTAPVVEEPVVTEPMVPTETVAQEPIMPEPVMPEEPIAPEPIMPEPVVPQEPMAFEENLTPTSKEETGSITLKMCKKCGKMNPANSSFCNNCGNEL